MNFGQGMQLPKNFNNQSIQNRGFNKLPTGINNNVANRVSPVKPVDRTFKSIDGTSWSTFEEASNHNKKYYNNQDKFKNGNY